MSCSEGLCTVEHSRLKGEELETYEQLLGHSGLNLYEDLHFRNVKIFKQDYLHEVYTVNPELPHLVMIHGFGGSSYAFQHLYQHLHKQFQLHSLDAPGIGYSSFGDYQYNCSQTLDYHLDSMEEWRKAVGI
jgi:pimeloyl-ACP methyl ester carboxylesterase